jgi:hypothetical protein
MKETKEENELRTGETVKVEPLPERIWANSTRNMMALLEVFEKKRKEEASPKREAIVFIGLHRKQRRGGPML